MKLNDSVLRSQLVVGNYYFVIYNNEKQLAKLLPSYVYITLLFEGMGGKLFTIRRYSLIIGSTMLQDVPYTKTKLFKVLYETK